MRSATRSATLLVLRALGLAAGVARLAAGEQAPADSLIYHVDPSSRLVVKTGKAGLFGFAGHSHIIRALAVSGELVYRPGEPRSSLRITLPTDSLEVLTPPDSEEIRKVTRAMRTEVLHVEQYPDMRFVADSLNARNGRMELQLAVTMEGTTRRLPVAAEVTIGRDTIRATGSFTAKQTDFGITPFSGGPGGSVKVADRVTFCFDLVAVRGRGPGGGPPAAIANDARAVPGCLDASRAPRDSARRVM